MPKPVLLVRPESSTGGNERDAKALAELAIDSVIDPYLTVSTVSDSSEANALLREFSTAQWLVFTSARAVASFVELVDGGPSSGNLGQQLESSPNLRIGLVGQNTRDEFIKLFGAAVGLSGFHSSRLHLAPEPASSESLAREIIRVTEAAGESPGTVLFAKSNIALNTLPDLLTRSQFEVNQAVVYETREVSHPRTVNGLANGEFSAVLLRSPSAVWAVRKVAPQINAKIVTTAGATLQAALEAGFVVDEFSESPTAEAVAQAVAKALATPSQKDPA